MKQKIISISLLLSFMIVIAHEMVPHHHHEVKGNEELLVHNHSGDHAHHKEHQHEHEKSHPSGDSENPEQDQHQKFPLHFHSATSSEFDYARVGNNNVPSTFASPLILVLHSSLPFLNPDPPDQMQLKYWNHSITLFSSFNSGAIGLRAPPHSA